MIIDYISSKKALSKGINLVPVGFRLVAFLLFPELRAEIFDVWISAESFLIRGIFTKRKTMIDNDKCTESLCCWGQLLEVC